MEQNYSEQGSLMWLLWGSLAVGVMFNQARGLDSQQASDLHHLWRLEFTGFKWSILSYLSLSSAAFTTVWVQLTLLIHTEYTLIKWTHSAHTCSWERSSTKSAKERRDKKSSSSDEGKASNLPQNNLLPSIIQNSPSGSLSSKNKPKPETQLFF